MTSTDLRKVLKGNNIVYGFREAVKGIKNGKIKKVFLASNCTAKMRDDIKYYAKIGNVEVEDLDKDSSEIALIAKKNYLISVVGC